VFRTDLEIKEELTLKEVQELGGGFYHKVTNLQVDYSSKALTNTEHQKEPYLRTLVVYDIF